ncbi:creatininase family protein [Shimia sp. R11_0]|uniref:creatininase family protein n=1 Tax=Shimia sp. R11_0 TaxID=2821096 RepID=UPI001ADC4E75|nr:creatininase family protein [Shimia sp. R11_0]MBO9477856.1 creatininase family protein [Shimia sp. R11_0]
MSQLAATHIADARDAITAETPFLIPVGSTEPHGRFTPMGDYRLVDELAKRLAAATNSIAVPTLPFGHATYFQNAPGGIALSAETFGAVFSEIVGGLVRDGVKNILVLNGHGGNSAIIANQLRLMRAQHGIIIPSVNVWGKFDDAVWERAQPKFGIRAKGHGTEPMGSLNRYLFPDDCPPQKDVFRAGKGRMKGLPLISMHQGKFEDLEVNLPIFSEDISEDAKINGEDVPFSAEAGKIFFDDILHKLTRFVDAQFNRKSAHLNQGRNTCSEHSKA